MLRSDTCHICQVCGRPWARFNYKAVVCDNCRVFFFRKITLNRQYKCHYQNKCHILPQVRVNCSACRYQRCLEAHMDPDEVGKRFDKRPVVTVLSKRQYKIMISLIHEPLIAYGCKVLPMVGKISSAVEFVNIMAAFVEKGSLPKLAQIPFWKIFCRAFTSFLDFISGIEEIQKLDLIDKIKIIQYNCLDFVKYNIAYLQYQNKKNGYCMTKANFFLEDAPKNFWDTYPEGYGRTHQAIVGLFEKYSITQEETMFLKIIGLLLAPPALSEKGQIILVHAREKYSVLLGEIIRDKEKTLSKYEVITRVRNILSISTLVKENCAIGMLKQAEMVIKGYGRMQSKLAYDVHIRNF